MSINIKQKNINGENNANLSNSGNDINISIKNKLIWKARKEGFVVGIIGSVIAGFIISLIT